VARPVASTRTASSSTGSVRPPTTYGGGRFAFPVPGGYISQYYHASHPAIDVAAPYGSRIVAGGAGKVIYAGWNGNGGGYQVWIAHGSGLYTGYYHMSAISVGVGQSVGQGTTIGHVGMSGWATGPHCHFEVWQGYPWANGSYRVNPLGYL
jgi:murein DD-endopeptidase MepM/ murein hydrolase activator NlpD